MALTFTFGRSSTVLTDGTFAVMAACQATGLKEVERVVHGEGKGSLHFFHEHPSVFMSFIHACCKALQFSQALQHHKSWLILLSFSISLCVFSVWLSLPLPSPCLPPSQSTQSSCLGQTVTLPWHFSLCGPLTGGPTSAAATVFGSWLLFYELSRRQTIIFMLIPHLMKQNPLT